MTDDDDKDILEVLHQINDTNDSIAGNVRKLLDKKPASEKQEKIVVPPAVVNVAAPSPQPPIVVPPAAVNVTTPKHPTKWHCEITERDSLNLIKKFTLTATAQH